LFGKKDEVPVLESIESKLFVLIRDHFEVIFNVHPLLGYHMSQIPNLSYNFSKPSYLRDKDLPLFFGILKDHYNSLY